MRRAQPLPPQPVLQWPHRPTAPPPPSQSTEVRASRPARPPHLQAEVPTPAPGPRTPDPVRPHPADATAHGRQRGPCPSSPAAVVHLQGEAGRRQQLRRLGLPGLSARGSAGRGGGSAREQPQQRQQGQPGCHGEGEAGGRVARTDRAAD